MANWTLPSASRTGVALTADHRSPYLPRTRIRSTISVAGNPCRTRWAGRSAVGNGRPASSNKANLSSTRAIGVARIAATESKPHRCAPTSLMKRIAPSRSCTRMPSATPCRKAERSSSELRNPSAVNPGMGVTIASTWLPILFPLGHAHRTEAPDDSRELVQTNHSTPRKWLDRGCTELQGFMRSCGSRGNTQPLPPPRSGCIDRGGVGKGAVRDNAYALTELRDVDKPGRFTGITPFQPMVSRREVTVNSRRLHDQARRSHGLRARSLLAPSKSSERATHQWKMSRSPARIVRTRESSR